MIVVDMETQENRIQVGCGQPIGGYVIYAWEPGNEETEQQLIVMSRSVHRMDTQ